MGCVASRIDKDERVRNCRERKRLMKQLVVLRGQFADAQSAYLRGLKNTGVTLRQFTDSDSLELEIETTSSHPSPLCPPPLPPAPPTPPPEPEVDHHQTARRVTTQISQNASASQTWPLEDYLNPFPLYEEVDQIEDENWAETKMEFDEDDQEDEVVSNSLPDKSLVSEVVDDNSSTVSSGTKYTDYMPIKNTLDGIMKHLDDHFLKASACEKEMAVLMDINKGDAYLPQNLKENKRKRSNSAKVFSALSWSWSFKSLQSSQGASDLSGPSEPCRPGAHCITLEKLYAAEKKLYKEVKEVETAKLELERKLILLQKQAEENYNWNKTEKTRSCVENLESEIERLQFSIKENCSSILELINSELYPQLVALISGLKLMWRTMYKCHQKQNDISQRLNYLNDIQNMDFTSDYHHQATVQLETEVTYWYKSFCILTKSQRDYVKSLCRWIQLTNCLVDENQQSRHCSSVIRQLCEDWQLEFDKLPEKEASEAIMSFLSDIRAIFQQQIEELNLLRRKERLERRLQKQSDALAEMERRLPKESNSLVETEKRLEGSSSTVEVAPSDLSPKHPVSLKRSKIQALGQRVQAERTRYLNSVQATKTMTLNKLKTSLPSVFQALLEFSRASAQAFEQVHSHIKLNPASASSSRSVQRGHQVTEGPETTLSNEVENSTN